MLLDILQPQEVNLIYTKPSESPLILFDLKELPLSREGTHKLLFVFFIIVKTLDYVLKKIIINAGSSINAILIKML